MIQRTEPATSNRPPSVDETRTSAHPPSVVKIEAGYEIEGTTFKHRIAEVHATSMKRLSKIEAADDPADGAGEE